MKTSVILRPVVATVIACAPCLVSLHAGAQWFPVGPPQVISHEVTTKGGITYYRLSGLLTGGTCCQRIAGYEVRRQGSSLRQVVQQELWAEACIDVLCDPWVEEWVSVLGPLTPGDYTLDLLATNVLSPSPDIPWPWASLTFTVPTNTGLTLRISGPATPGFGSLMIEVNGVPNVEYVLQASADLADWFNIRTNLGPAGFSEPLSASRRFYRVDVQAAPSRPVSAAPGNLQFPAKQSPKLPVAVQDFR